MQLEGVYNNILYPDGKVPVDYTAIPRELFSSRQVAGNSWLCRIGSEIKGYGLSKVCLSIYKDKNGM
jgi:hypothetical protein